MVMKRLSNLSPELIWGTFSPFLDWGGKRLFVWMGRRPRRRALRQQRSGLLKEGGSLVAANGRSDQEIELRRHSVEWPLDQELERLEQKWLRMNSYLALCTEPSPNKWGVGADFVGPVPSLRPARPQKRIPKIRPDGLQVPSREHGAMDVTKPYEFILTFA